MQRQPIFQEAIQEEGQETIKVISMGQGQGPIAEREISRAIRQGHWVFLQNCDLIPSWHLRLEKILEKIRKAEVIDNFRLGGGYLTKEKSQQQQ